SEKRVSNFVRGMGTVLEIAPSRPLGDKDADAPSFDPLEMYRTSLAETLEDLSRTVCNKMNGVGEPIIPPATVADDAGTCTGAADDTTSRTAYSARLLWAGLGMRAFSAAMVALLVVTRLVDLNALVL